MSDIPIYVCAIMLSTWLVIGCLLGRVYRSVMRALWAQLALSGVVGGGVYGLLLFDGGIWPVWSWARLLTVVIGTAVVVVVGDFFVNRFDKIEV